MTSSSSFAAQDSDNRRCLVRASQYICHTHPGEGSSPPPTRKPAAHQFVTLQVRQQEAEESAGAEVMVRGRKGQRLRHTQPASRGGGGRGQEGGVWSARNGALPGQSYGPKQGNGRCAGACKDWATVRLCTGQREELRLATWCEAAPAQHQARALALTQVGATLAHSHTLGWRTPIVHHTTPHHTTDHTAPHQ